VSSVAVPPPGLSAAGDVLHVTAGAPPSVMTAFPATTEERCRGAGALRAGCRRRRGVSRGARATEPMDPRGRAFSSSPSTGPAGRVLGLPGGSAGDGAGAAGLADCAAVPWVNAELNMSFISAKAAAVARVTSSSTTSPDCMPCPGAGGSTGWLSSVVRTAEADCCSVPSAPAGCLMLSMFRLRSAMALSSSVLPSCKARAAANGTSSGATVAAGGIASLAEDGVRADAVGGAARCADGAVVTVTSSVTSAMVSSCAAQSAGASSPPTQLDSFPSCAGELPDAT